MPQTHVQLKQRSVFEVLITQTAHTVYSAFLVVVVVHFLKLTRTNACDNVSQGVFGFVVLEVGYVAVNLSEGEQDTEKYNKMGKGEKE
jgi:hypothetical protein